jgi:hypothetical protein
MRVINDGFVFDVQATASADRKNVTMTLRPQYSRLANLFPEPWPDSPPDRHDLIMQVPQVEQARLQTTITIPNQGTAAILMQPEIPPREIDRGNGPEPSGMLPKPMLLLIKPTLIVQREIPEK